MKKTILITATALVLALGIGTAAFAKHGQQEHSGSIFHSGQKHSQNNNAQQQGRNLSFEQHGGGHEQAQDNDAIHANEQKDPRHSDNGRHN